MSHLVRKTDIGDIDLDTVKGYIFFQQRWRYDWLLGTATTRAWNLAEKRAFHNTADRQIWGRWSQRFRMIPIGTGDLPRRFPDGLKIDLDVKWVLKDGHYTVKVTKFPPPPDRSKVSFVDWPKKEIVLFKWDVTPSSVATDDGKDSNPNFYTVPHEFGHTLGNVFERGNGDEYRNGHLHRADVQSILNIGTKVRDRHLRMIRDELDQMVKGVQFAIRGPDFIDNFVEKFVSR